MLFRRFGLWPSPNSNHVGEYFSWAHEFVATELQFFHDPAAGSLEDPITPDPGWHYSIDRVDTASRTAKSNDHFEDGPEDLSRASVELAVPIMESLRFSIAHELPAVNLMNRGAIPNLPFDTVVETPGVVEAGRLSPQSVDPLPEAIAATLRTQASIQKLCVEAFVEGSKQKLLQAILIDPTIDSYSRAAYMVEDFLIAEKDRLPRFV